MYRLLVVIVWMGLTVNLLAQSPHGPQFKVNCSDCHTSASWEIPFDKWDRTGPVFSKTTGWQIGWDTAQFSHTKTNFPLTGQHIQVDCRACHTSMVFSEASTNCVACHTDMHNGTVGKDCARCHSTANWLVDNISELHQENGFPLVGAHAGAACLDCHKSETALRFDRIGNECINCHRSDFAATTNPNHHDAGFSSNCVDCHDITHFDWKTDKVKHDFFPLTKGHEIQDCAKCHSSGSYANTPADCISCHKPDYDATLKPSHTSAQFSQNCVDCHTTDLNWMPAKYSEHDAAYFPIYSGTHKGVWNQCQECHANASNYAEFTCTTCHVNPETDNKHTGVNGYSYNSPACLACHPTGSGTDVFDHAKTNFPLTGVHQTTDCLKCHASGYAGTPTDCASCHSTDYQQSANPNHTTLAIPTDCASCHTTSGWQPATFAIHDNYYPLHGAHAAIAADCAQCHTGGNYSNTPNTCAGCHTPDYNQTTNPNHAAAQFPTDCATCHSESSWVPSSFDHNDIYPLTGAHAAIAADCAQCHAGGNYSNTPNTCAGCHTPDYNQSANPNHTALAIPTDCAGCHTTAGWEPATFAIHNNYYPLNGAHAAIANDCATCHKGNYTNTPNTCAGCHTPDYNQTTNPNHATQQFPTDCATCHSETAWAPSTFNHNSFYPLNGAHAAIANDCATCHQGNYTNTPNTCAGCHTPDYNQTTNPNHAAAHFPTDCATCHSETAWVPSTFDHSKFYPLTGAHAGIANDCDACHHGTYTNTPNTCAGCHTPDYNQSANPNHVALGIPTDCASCHTPAGWEPATFAIHNNYYPLNGAHAAIANDCATCHQGNYTNTPNTCAGCHTPDYNQTTNPNHAAAHFPTDCATCHSETAWVPSTFDHSKFYPLTGAHATIANDCDACHHGTYTNTPNTCAGCHTPDYNQSANPNHVALAIPTDCATCHTTSGWEPATFAIHNNYYPLNGAHAAIATDCAACHNGNYNNTPNTCAGCHVGDFNQTTNPNHVTQQFPTDCATCHSETAWVPSTFDHNAVYPLTGAHAAIANDCAVCHQGNYTNPPNTCAGCHTPDYNQSTNPNHVALAIPTDCAGCHTTSGWEPATFAIHNNYYPLNGAHAAIANDCAVCHQGNYTNTPNTCAGCHTPDYNQTTNPNHTAAQFPTDCASCHSETAWVPATFDHDGQYFPIYSGAHQGQWNQCADCHTNPSNFAEFTCTTCHTNPETNNQHNGVNGYSYNSPACLACHPTGDANNVFNHSNTNFPLTGAHQTADCIDCHAGGYAGTPTDCAACHTPNYNQTTNPNHAALGIPTDCATCHTTAGWAPATFALHDNYYPLTGAHAAIANDCAVCHQGNYTNPPNTCAGCHTPDYNQSTNPNHVALAIPTDCATCHTTSGWEPATFAIHNNYYPLNGAHAAIATDCAACHNGNYNNTPNTCAGCHIGDFNQTTNPNHVTQQFPTDCATCHSETAWVPSTFDHNAVYPLTGAHAAIANDCAVCHQGNYTNPPNTCAGCHTPDYNQSTNPNHVALAIPTDCATCHTTSGWEPATFAIHNNYYPLNGAHAAIATDCAACHNGNYNNTPNTCAGCHIGDFNQTTNPNHVTQQFPTDCATCHSETAWVPSTFDHNAVYPLTGAHAAIANDCAVCHQGNYTNPPNTCAGCHTPDYNQSTNPNHVALALPTDCATCHTTSGWEPATFAIHNNYYPLNGAHAAIATDCAACHNGNYNNTPNTCAGCHIGDFNQTTNPNHVTQQFPTDCATCHSETAWVPSTFDHNAVYPLTGAHAAIANDCAVCHQGNYTNPPNTCAGCHTPDYNQSTNPNHVALAIPTDCATCHTTSGWEPATFAIHNNYYPLNGAHAAIATDCAACHNGNYNNTPNTCAGCHIGDFNQTTNPNHVTQQFPTDCATCHSETAWVPSTFDHNAVYPLTGAHAAIANNCNICHNGNYTNTPNTCVSCHQSDYNQANNPNHASAGFPTTCQDCHTTTAWVPSTFDHDNMYFHIYTGAHENAWDQCTDCHITPGNFSAFSCTVCHTNPQTNNHHQGVPGYVYSSPACYACHPTGNN